MKLSDIKLNYSSIVSLSETEKCDVVLFPVEKYPNVMSFLSLAQFFYTTDEKGEPYSVAGVALYRNGKFKAIISRCIFSATFNEWKEFYAPIEVKFEDFIRDIFNMCHIEMQRAFEKGIEKGIAESKQRIISALFGD